jgi:hypothetical protein
MIHGHEKSGRHTSCEAEGGAIRCEAMERRAKDKGNAGQQSAHRAQCRAPRGAGAGLPYAESCTYGSGPFQRVRAHRQRSPLTVVIISNNREGDRAVAWKQLLATFCAARLRAYFANCCQVPAPINPLHGRRRMANLAKLALRKLGFELRRIPKSAPRLDMLAHLRHVASLGFQPATVIDVGAAEGTPPLYAVFPKAPHVLVEPLREFEPQLKELTDRSRRRTTPASRFLPRSPAIHGRFAPAR